jgi:threonine dehydrogenase-like Zn-dependent dehydrogenase
MRAVVVTPGEAGSGRLEEVPDPSPAEDEVLVEVLEVGVCGTDVEILEGLYGTAPEGDPYLIIGHENFGRVLSAPPGSGFSAGDLVACTVRRPDPVPCVACAGGRQDLCVNGRYTERGIKGLHGFMAERYVERPEFLVAVPAGLESVGVLLEPLSVVEKGVIEAFEMQRRIPWEPREAVVTGAGPIGLMAMLLLRLRGMDVWVVDRNPRGGLKSSVVEAAGAHYVQSDETTLPELAARIEGIDLFVEATAVPEIVFAAIDAIGPNGVVCLTGVSAGSRTLEVPGAELNLQMVLENKVVFGTVNASRRDWEAGATDLAAFEATWPGLCARVLTRRVPVERYAEVLEREGDDIKNTVRFASP